MQSVAWDSRRHGGQAVRGGNAYTSRQPMAGVTKCVTEPSSVADDRIGRRFHLVADVARYILGGEQIS